MLKTTTNTASANRPSLCEWCGSLVILREAPGQRVSKYEPSLDEEKRYLRDYEGNLIGITEHLCKVRCSVCGEMLILRGGSIFERIMDAKNNAGPGKAHTCPRVRGGTASRSQPSR